MAAPLHAGFDDPVHDAQATFRALMVAMAEPGRIEAIARAPRAPEPLGPGLAALALCLCDVETPIHLDAALARAPEVAAYLRFHTGAAIVDDPAAAEFALVVEPAGAFALERYATGTPAYPDRSTTLLVRVETLEDGAPLALAGAGIDGRAALRVAPLPPGFVAARRATRGDFPLGLDVVFVAGARLVALPRSTRIED